MERIVFNSDGKSMQYEMLIGTSLNEFGIEICRFLPCGRVFILTDSNVAPLFLEDVSAALRAFGIDVLSLVVSAGEENKRLETVQSILAFLLNGNASRSDVLLCFGGGVIGDMGGFAASVYMRGINFIAMPTTLIGMTDSSVGGKTGVDFCGVKNAVGSFHAPVLVVCCTDFLKTLPLRELHSGIGEIIKYAVIGGDSILNLLQGGIINNAALISACCEIKRKFVEEDEFDNGTRRILNLGHTFGHVFEAASRFSLSHGEAVGLGLAAAADFGEKLGFTKRGIAQKIISLLREQGLKTNYAPYCTETAAELLLHDKKGDRSGIDMVFIKEFGHVFTHRVSTESAIAFLTSFCWGLGIVYDLRACCGKITQRPKVDSQFTQRSDTTFDSCRAVRHSAGGVRSSSE